MRDVIGCTLSGLLVLAPFLVAVLSDRETRALFRPCGNCGAPRLQECRPYCR